MYRVRGFWRWERYPRISRIQRIKGSGYSSRGCLTRRDRSSLCLRQGPSISMHLASSRTEATRAKQGFKLSAKRHEKTVTTGTHKNPPPFHFEMASIMWLTWLAPWLALACGKETFFDIRTSISSCGDFDWCDATRGLEERVELLVKEMTPEDTW